MKLSDVIKKGSKAEMIKAIKAASLDELKSVFGSLTAADKFLQQLGNLS